MRPYDAEKMPQEPTPEEGDAPRSERDAWHPTRPSPDSPQASGSEDAEYAGKVGPDAADRPIAEEKSDPDHEPDIDSIDDLDSDEKNNLRASRETAHKTHEAGDSKE